MSVVKIVDHPLIQHKISLMRDRNKIGRAHV